MYLDCDYHPSSTPHPPLCSFLQFPLSPTLDPISPSFPPLPPVSPRSPPFSPVFPLIWQLKSPQREVVRSSAGAGVVYPPFLGGHSRSIPQGMILDVQPLVKSLFCPIRQSPNGFFDSEASIPQNWISPFFDGGRVKSLCSEDCKQWGETLLSEQVAVEW